MSFLRTLLIFAVFEILILVPQVLSFQKSHIQDDSSHLSKKEIVEIVNNINFFFEGYSTQFFKFQVQMRAEEISKTKQWGNLKEWSIQSWMRVKDQSNSINQKGKQLQQSISTKQSSKNLKISENYSPDRFIETQSRNKQSRNPSNQKNDQEQNSGNNQKIKNNKNNNTINTISLDYMERSYLYPSEIINYWSWSNQQNQYSDAYNKAKQQNKYTFSDGKNWKNFQTLIKQKILKTIQTKAYEELTDRDLENMEKDLQILSDLLSFILDWGVNYYFVIKQEVKYQMKLKFDQKGVEYANLLFERFEIKYIKQAVEKIRSAYQLIYITGGKEAVEIIEKQFLQTYEIYFEPATLIEISNFFDSIYQTELYKQINTLKQEETQNLTYQDRLYQALWELFLKFDSDPEIYKQAKTEALQSIEQEFGSNLAEQTRVEIEKQESEWIKIRFEEIRIQFEVAAIFGSTQEAQELERITLEVLNNVFEPGAIEAIKELFGKIYKIVKADSLQDALVQIKPQLKQALESIFLSIYRNLKAEILVRVQQQYGEEGVSNASQAIIDFEVEWVNQTLQSNKDMIQLNLEWNGVKGHQKAKQGFIENYNNTLDQRAIEEAEEFFDQYTEELYAALEEVRPIFEEAINNGIEVYGELKKQVLGQVESEQSDSFGKTKLLFATFEIEYINQKLEEKRPLLELVLAFDGKVEVEKVEQEILEQVSSIFDYNAIIEIQSFFDSIYAFEQTESQLEETNSTSMYRVIKQTKLNKKLPSLKLFKQAQKDESQDNDEQDYYQIDSALESEVNQEVELTKVKILQVIKQEFEDQAYDFEDEDMQDYYASDEEILDEDEYDLFQDIFSDFQVEYMKKINNLKLLQEKVDSESNQNVDEAEQFQEKVEIKIDQENVINTDDQENTDTFKLSTQQLLLKDLNSGKLFSIIDAKTEIPTFEQQSYSFNFYFSLISIVALLVIGILLLGHRSRKAILRKKEHKNKWLFRKDNEIEQHLL